MKPKYTYYLSKSVLKRSLYRINQYGLIEMWNIKRGWQNSMCDKATVESWCVELSEEQAKKVKPEAFWFE